MWAADMTCQPECMWCKLLQDKRHSPDIAMKERISTLSNQRLLLDIEQSMRCLLHDVQVGWLVLAVQDFRAETTTSVYHSTLND